MKNERKRLVLWSKIIVSIVLLINVRFFDLSIIQHNALDAAVIQQRVRVLVQTPERGEIVDRDGNILAMSLLTDDIAVYPNLIATKYEMPLARSIAQILGLPVQTVYRDVTARGANGQLLDWSSVENGVSTTKAAEIQKLGLGAIEITPTPERYYPNGNLASTVLGFVNQAQQPGAGLEVSLNDYLAGSTGYTAAETDSLGNVIPIGLEDVESAHNGDTVKLTIDSYIQGLLEQNIDQAEKTLKAKAIYGIVMNPNNGQILAMASTPSFNPNQYQNASPSVWDNSPVGFTFEPGSIFKPIVMSIALRDGVVQPDTTFYDPGYYTLGNTGYTVHDAEGINEGNVSLSTIIAQSLNVGMVHVTLHMTPQQMINGLHEAGIGEMSGISLPGDSAGIMATVGQLETDPVQKATMSFGQGVSVTPVQIITADSEVINGGHKIQAHIVESITDQHGNVLYRPNESESVQIYPKWVSALVKSYLLADWRGGTFSTTAISGYNGGGKTGTANIPNPAGGYLQGSDAYVGSVIGFMPYRHPRYMTLIDVDYPTGFKNGIAYGAEVAGPIWHSFMQQLLQYEGMPPNNVPPPPTYHVPNVEGMLTTQAIPLIQKAIAHVQIVQTGKGMIVQNVDFSDQNGQMVATLDDIPVAQNGSVTVPNLLQFSRAFVTHIFSHSGVSLTIHGDGRVVAQSLAPGRYETPIKMTIWCKP